MANIISITKKIPNISWWASFFTIVSVITAFYFYFDSKKQDDFDISLGYSFSKCIIPTDYNRIAYDYNKARILHYYLKHFKVPSAFSNLPFDSMVYYLYTITSTPVDSFTKTIERQLSGNSFIDSIRYLDMNSQYYNSDVLTLVIENTGKRKIDSLTLQISDLTGIYESITMPIFQSQFGRYNFNQGLLPGQGSVASKFPNKRNWVNKTDLGYLDIDEKMVVNIWFSPLFGSNNNYPAILSLSPDTHKRFLLKSKRLSVSDYILISLIVISILFASLSYYYSKKLKQYNLKINQLTAKSEI